MDTDKQKLARMFDLVFDTKTQNFMTYEMAGASPEYGQIDVSDLNKSFMVSPEQKLDGYVLKSHIHYGKEFYDKLKSFDLSNIIRPKKN